MEMCNGKGRTAHAVDAVLSQAEDKLYFLSSQMPSNSCYAFRLLAIQQSCNSKVI